jgi:hypothetical protein
MTFSSSLGFFDHLMNEGDVDELKLVAFLKLSTSDEGLHLDFKSGKELEKPKDKRNFTIRQYVAAFANSEGGVLVVGVKDQTREEKKAKAPKNLEPITTAHESAVGNDLKAWAASCVAELVGYLGTPPRFSTIDVAGGKVLLVAVPRAPSLVPVIKDGKQAYYFRVEDEAREVYPHLIADLLLGRRNAPRILVEGMSAKLRVELAPHNGSTPAQVTVRSDIHMLVKNESLVTAHRIFPTLIAFSYNPTAPFTSTALESQLTIDRANIPDHYYPLQHRPQWRGAVDDNSRLTSTLRPFEMISLRLEGPWRLPLTTGPRRWLGALCLVPDGCPPQWFEIELSVPTGLSDSYDTDGQISARPVFFGRPRIGAVAEVSG